MHLQVDGDPHPTVRWSKDGDVLESGKRIKVVAGKGLRLLNVHPTDAGVYVCTAENDAGSVEASTWVTVSEPPVSLINLILLMFIKSFISFSPY